MIATLVLLAVSSDPIFGPDKAKHAAGSFIIFTSAYTLTDDFGDRRAAVSAGGATVSLGLLKELYDWKTKGRFSWRDLLWDGVGLALGMGAIWVGKRGNFD